MIMIERPKTPEDARRILREAIDSSSYRGNVAALTRALWQDRRGKDFIRDFLRRRKHKLGGAAETAAVERELKLAAGMLAVLVEADEPSEPDRLIEEAMRVTARLIDPHHHWKDAHFRLAAQLFRVCVADNQLSAEDMETRRLQLEIVIRRAFQKENL